MTSSVCLEMVSYTTAAWLAQELQSLLTELEHVPNVRSEIEGRQVALILSQTVPAWSGTDKHYVMKTYPAEEPDGFKYLVQEPLHLPDYITSLAEAQKITLALLEQPKKILKRVVRTLQISKDRVNMSVQQVLDNNFFTDSAKDECDSEFYFELVFLLRVSVKGTVYSYTSDSFIPFPQFVRFSSNNSIGYWEELGYVAAIEWRKWLLEISSDFIYTFEVDIWPASMVLFVSIKLIQDARWQKERTFYLHNMIEVNEQLLELEGQLQERNNMFSMKSILKLVKGKRDKYSKVQIEFSQVKQFESYLYEGEPNKSDQAGPACQPSMTHTASVRISFRTNLEKKTDITVEKLFLQ